mmetsp:Transcript_26524/g.38028  ORF Transcript_26524/g.38028 Transcript_26524/m.38028 type:complete len:130 (-) Transcript_26524:113-502(-)
MGIDRDLFRIPPHLVMSWHLFFYRRYQLIFHFWTLLEERLFQATKKNKNLHTKLGKNPNPPYSDNPKIQGWSGQGYPWVGAAGCSANATVRIHHRLTGTLIFCDVSPLTIARKQQEDFSSSPTECIRRK